MFNSKLKKEIKELGKRIRDAESMIWTLQQVLKRRDLEMWILKNTKKISSWEIIYKPDGDPLCQHPVYEEETKKIAKEGYKFLTTYPCDTRQELWVKE